MNRSVINGSKRRCSLKEGESVCLVRLEGGRVLRSPSRKANVEFEQLTFSFGPIKRQISVQRIWNRLSRQRHFQIR